MNERVSDGRWKSSRAKAERKHVLSNGKLRESKALFASSRAIIARESRHLPERKLARVGYIDLVQQFRPR